jgi:hypothetical protein
MQLRFLRITGPDVSPAEIKFGPGLNVIYGGSNTGKSHILRLVDYVLGAGKPPEPISEQARYDLVHLGVLLGNGQEKTFVRALGGGNVRVLDGLRPDVPTAKEGVPLSAKHGANSISMYLLQDIASAGRRLRTDAKGETKELSFRDFKPHILVDEAKVQSDESPIQGGQVFNRTRELSVFKYMLTGVDDSALDIAKPEKGYEERQAAQLELLDRQIDEVERSIEQSANDLEEIERVDAALTERISDQFRVQEQTEEVYQRLSAERNAVRARLESAQERSREIDLLQARFGFLLQHYDADIERLKGIIDAGHVYDAEPDAYCSVCGSAPEHHDPARTCDGDIPAIIDAAGAELREVTRRRAELVETAKALRDEKAEVQSELPAIQQELQVLASKIQREVPSVTNVRSATQALVAQRLAIQGELELVRRRAALIEQRDEIGVSPGYDATTLIAENQLNGATLNAFCEVVEAELQSWQFPDARRVFFENNRRDISVAGKSRASNGKGVRALLHAAFSIGLMKFCRTRDRPHPGFLMIDSLFITYRDPSNDEESQIAQTPLRDRAFREFKAIGEDLQLIILENVDVPKWLESDPQCIQFTGRPGVGRAGLFPSQANP